MNDETQTGVGAFNPETALHLLIERVDRLERVLRNVRAAMPQEGSGAMEGPSDRQRLGRVAKALAELE